MTLTRFVGVGVLALLVSASSATAATRWSVLAGTSLGVNGAPGQGGSAGSIEMSLPVEDGGWRFGAALSAADQGTARVELRDPNDGTLLGRVGDLHRWTYSLEWFGTRRLAGGRGWASDATLGFGWSRQQLDRRGSVNDAVSGALLSARLDLTHPVANGQRLGLALGWHRALLRTAADPGRSTQWATAALAWHWQRTPKE